MLEAIYRVKKRVPASVWKAITAPYWWWYNRARHQVAAVGNPRWRESVRQIRKLRGIHRGERCFILGNGPSLRETDLSLLRDEITFGMNRIYMLFDEIGFSTSYHVAINTLVIEQSASEIKRLTMPKFITWRGRRWMADDPGTVFLDTDYTPPATFSKDATGRIFEGSTVTYVALQLAYYFGFDEVILIGVDHHFSTEGPANVTVVSEGDDPNHFSPGYFGRGYRWQLPDLEASERAYRLALEAFHAAGRSVVDATVGGRLLVFPKVDYKTMF
ncbi:MAG TPA: 6-hydroxymethylpterin diphosphokinase MptE-like protein [Anaerolineales bacterium]|nr:6-hydroxymethylpterin diphosphokinase MptE-like protein [Anaerolineales bacterium]